MPELNVNCKSIIRFAQTYIPRKGDLFVQTNQSQPNTGNAIQNFNSGIVTGSLLPNPTSGTAQLQMSIGSYELLVTDALGRQVEARVFTDNVEVDLTKQESGLYFIRVQNITNGDIKTFRLVRE